MGPDKHHIREILKDCDAIRFGDFSLASGKRSKYYIDIRNVVTRPKSLKMICDHIIKKMKNYSLKPDYIACVELGAVPIGVIVSDRTGLPLIMVRKAEKDHGIKDRLVGFKKGRDPAGTVLLLEDETTTGGSVLSAAKVLKDEGLVIDAIITVVSRQEGSEEAISGAGIMLISLITAEEILKN